MPVRDLTERPQIPRLGKIRLGAQSGTNGAPVNLPYFVVPPEVAEVYGEKPTELNVVFLSDDLERIASQYYRAYNKSNGLICKGDGFRADALLDEKALTANGGALDVSAWAHGTAANIIRKNISCAGGGYEGQPACPMFAAKKCAVRGFYQFAIKDAPGLGVYQMDTGSMVSIRKMNGAIEMARQMLGGAAGIPMKLRRVQEEVSPDGKKKKVWMVTLEVDTRLSLTRLMELHGGPVAQALLPPVDETEIYDRSDEEAIEGEHRLVEPETPGGVSAGTVGEEKPSGGNTVATHRKRKRQYLRLRPFRSRPARSSYARSCRQPVTFARGMATRSRPSSSGRRSPSLTPSVIRLACGRRSTSSAMTQNGSLRL